MEKSGALRAREMARLWAGAGWEGHVSLAKRTGSSMVHDPCGHTGGAAGRGEGEGGGDGVALGAGGTSNVGQMMAEGSCSDLAHGGTRTYSVGPPKRVSYPTTFANS